MDQAKLNRFFTVYERHLMDVVSNKANGYCFGPDKVPIVVVKMKAAVVGGTYSKDGLAFRRTCSELGIKHTYTAIKEFLSSHT